MSRKGRHDEGALGLGLVQAPRLGLQYVQRRLGSIVQHALEGGSHEVRVDERVAFVEPAVSLDAFLGLFPGGPVFRAFLGPKFVGVRVGFDVVYHLRFRF